ncbi:putative undecaprenyl-phosphate alpha-N-acetylglucosaminyl 1-phosphate transferase [Sulfuricella denitrificans skB26]|uniref:Putative undecaprenyl-phosphate alpha-N-acetylglucosaminyl 1-phosphate transferase n=1 Tax=Sulfuricella denitrificans (strain DSM 22764 / NBRC 105220 / skB26) TaxID=1163617 RepID=S6AGN1_SULDS|nr:MraY family glycosyltransferase [Sulfuricella denitrificans]BAN35176.1 putative undecaprenyl-phosphate alpha-N-acetylglucosaminyl 1-phosphate transferase [Sulfuricella denitrificans skB26]
MNFLFVLLTALLVSMAIIPIMIRLAPVLGMVDLPDPRKVHSVPIPRVGGIGIVLGALISILLWVPISSAIAFYLFGSVVLLIFGTWDDCRELGHYVKFIGQFVAVIGLVYFGDVWVALVPFMDDPLPAYIGKPFTVVAIVGMINAINHSDGLDGLAAGESMLSLACVAYLAYVADGIAVTLIALAVMGGVFGFLRFNTHPARVFMGDSGSQFLGFSLGALAVILTQQTNTGLSMALPALILGLPIVDILAVFAQRAYQGLNWFKATRNHIHHRLLDLGFDHYQSVVVIYAIQTFFVLSALALQYEADAVLLSLYLGVCALVFVLLILGERTGWRVNRHGSESRLSRFVLSLKSHPLFSTAPTLFIRITVPAFFVIVSLWVGDVPRDFGLTGVAIAAVLLVAMLFDRVQSNAYLVRIAIYGTAAFLVYLTHQYTSQLPEDFPELRWAYFVALALAIVIVVRYVHDVDFRSTPMDYLVVFLVIASGLFMDGASADSAFGEMVIKGVILFYGCEIIINRGNKFWGRVLNISVMAASGILGAKGLLQL